MHALILCIIFLAESRCYRLENAVRVMSDGDATYLQALMSSPVDRDLACHPFDYKISAVVISVSAQLPLLPASCLGLGWYNDVLLISRIQCLAPSLW